MWAHGICCDRTGGFFTREEEEEFAKQLIIATMQKHCSPENKEKGVTLSERPPYHDFATDERHRVTSLKEMHHAFEVSEVVVVETSMCAAAPPPAFLSLACCRLSACFCDRLRCAFERG